jgi:uncharacterized protein YcbK (DUF882 family)
MALPVLNNQNSIANLPMDASYISQAVLTAASRTGHLQIYNNGSINFSNNISGGGNVTASRESSNEIGNTGVKILYEIRAYLESINNKIENFIATSEKQNQVTQNLIEASAGTKDYEITPTASKESGSPMNFKETFENFFNGMKDTLSSLKDGGGFLGTMIKGLTSGIGKFLLKAFGATIVAYIGAKALGQIKIGDKTISERVGEYVNEASEELSKFFGESEPESGQGQASPTTATSDQLPSTGSATATQPSATPERTQTSTQTSQTSGGQMRTVPVRSLPTPKRDSSGEISGLTFSHSDQKRITDEIASLTLGLQQKLGRKFLIVSGRRSKSYNEKIPGAAKNSAHLRGTAVDLYWEGGRPLSKEDFLKIIPLASSMGALGIGIYPGKWIHIDIDKNGRRAWGPDGSRSSIPKWAEEAIQKHERNEYSKDVEYVKEEPKEVEKEPQTSSDIKNLNKPKEETTEPQTSSDIKNLNKPTEPQTSSDIKNLNKPTETQTSSPSATKVDSSEAEISENNIEEEDESEETSEKVIEDPSIKNLEKKTATKEKKNVDFPEPYAEVKQYIYDKSVENGINPSMMLGLAQRESRFNPRITSKIKKNDPDKIGVGVFQITGQTADELGLPRSERTDYKKNTDAAMIYMKKILKEFDGNEYQAVTAWNMGIGGLKKALSQGKDPSKLTEGPHAKVVMKNSKKWETLLASKGMETQGASAKPAQEPTFTEKAKTVGRALMETGEEAIDSLKEFEKDPQSWLHHLTHKNWEATTADIANLGIGSMYDLMGVPKENQVRINTSNPDRMFVEKLQNKEVEVTLEKNLESQKQESARSGDLLSSASAQLNAAVQESNKPTKSEEPAPQININNTQQGREENSTFGRVGSVPNTRNDEPTWLAAIFNSIKTALP